MVVSASLQTSNGESSRSPPLNSAAYHLQSVPDCIFCGAQRLPYEAAGMCCSKGDVVLTSTEMPPPLVQLFTSHDPLAKHFRSCVRTYNNTFAFTSIGIYNYDKGLCRRNQGIYTFRVQGQIYHFINDLLPDGCPPRNLQLYFYDTDHALASRLDSTDRLDGEVVQVLMEVMRANPYAQFFKKLSDVDQSDEFSIILNSNPCLDQRVYNRPTTSQVAAVWVEDGCEGGVSNRNIRVYARSGRSQNIHYYYGCYDPLQYPLLFPRGEVGWHEGIPKGSAGMVPGNPTPTASLSITARLFATGESLIAEEARMLSAGNKKHSVSCRQYYAYKLQLRRGDTSFILHSGRLFQQYIVDLYIKIETQRLDYYRSKQRECRGDTFQGLVDSIGAGVDNTNDVGRRVILPGSFIGGPRDMRGRYMDAMALVQNYGKPDLFITITCNPNWPEIKEHLRFVDEAQNRPDLVARVFRARLEEFKKDILSRSLFGKVVAYTYVIEFQKRGLPHAHFLLILSRECKITTSTHCNQLITAELPNPATDPTTYDLVKKHMMHGPCGEMNPQCPCMVLTRGSGSSECRSKYPHSFAPDTVFDDNCFPSYRRRDLGITVLVRKHLLDSRWVVPYNIQLLRKYDCHINVEACASVRSVKYIYKYVYKGHDRVSMSLAETRDNEVIDEISDFQKARWISAPEAAWRIFAFPISEMRPAVLQLQVHLENSQYLTFYGNQRITYITQDSNSKKTMLTEFFSMNIADQVAKSLQLLYVEFPHYFVWNGTRKAWTQRKRNEVIGRLVSVNPMEGERYYLRLLLSNVRGPTSFVDLKRIGNEALPTYRAAAERRGLLAGDFVIRASLDEAVLFQLPSSLRKLFATHLCFSDVPNPRSLWEAYKDHLCEDFARFQPNLEAEMAALIVLRDLFTGMGKDIDSYNLVDVDMRENLDESSTREVMAELNITVSDADLNGIPALNNHQRAAFDSIMAAVHACQGGVFFVDGPGGTGKSFLYRCLLAATRTNKWIALATASSGIASSILPGGRTAHSRFKLPLDGESKYVCNIGKRSSEARLLREARLILWDEASMANRLIVESLDTTMRDILDTDALFGGRVMVFGGDFRQTLPVVRSGTRHDFVDACLLRSMTIWPHVHRLRLTLNMRAHEDPEFCDYLLRIGNGTEPTVSLNRIKIPSNFLIPWVNETVSLDSLIAVVYPILCLFETDPYGLMSRAILTTKNTIVDFINSFLLCKFPGDEHTFLSYDTPIDPKNTHCEDYLHTLAPSGLPPHKLCLKHNCPIMLLRNLNPCDGLCNGTRLICDSFGEHILSCYIATGDHKGKHVFIPKIPLEVSKDEKCPIPFKRTQFPVKVCFAMTINKSQGQTLDFVGIYLKEPVFSHGQLYVAMSRARNADSIKIVICPDEPRPALAHTTPNVVFEEILPFIN